MPEVADDGQDPAVAERAERLRITLCDLLKVVSITLEAGDNAQVIAGAPRPAAGADGS